MWSGNKIVLLCCLAIGLLGCLRLNAKQGDWAMRAWYRMKAPPGAAFVVIRGDSIFRMDGFGSRMADDGEPVDQETVFRAGSIGKTVIALGIFRLVEGGKLSLSSRVDSLLPDIAEEAGTNWGKELQVQHLLEHSSGLDEMHFNEYYAAESMDLKSALLFNPASKQLRWQPGRTASYSNIGYALLALIGERVSGKPWQLWLQEEVLGPLKMKDSGFGQVPESYKNKAIGHEGLKPVDPAPLYLYTPSVSFYTNISDFSLLLGCLMQQGTPLLKPSSMLRLESMRTTPAGRTGLEVGYGAGVQNDYVGGWLCRYHTGKVDGFTAIYEYFPEQNSGFAVLFNGTPKGSIRTAPLVHSCRARCVPRRSMPDAPIYLKSPLKKLNPDDFPGTYSFSNPRNAIPGFFDRWMLEIEVERTGENSFQVAGEDWFWIGSGRLVKTGGLHAGAAFSLDEETGRLGLTMGKLYYVKGSGAQYRKLFRWILWGLSILLIVWLVGSQFARKRPSWGLLFLALPILASELAFKIFLDAKPTGLGALDFQTMVIFLLSCLVPIATLLGAWFWGRKAKEMIRKPVGILWLLLVLLDLGLTYALWSEGLIGLATWAY